MNTKLCDRFSVTHYPMLFWGPPLKFASGGWEPKDENSEIRTIEDGRTADRLLNWINKQIGRSVKFLSVSVYSLIFKIECCVLFIICILHCTTVQASLIVARMILLVMNFPNERTDILSVQELDYLKPLQE